MRGWRTAKCKLSKTTFIYFSVKHNILIYGNTFCQSSISRNDSIKDLAMFLDSKFHFHIHVNHISSHCIELLGLFLALPSPSRLLNACTDYTRAIRKVTSSELLTKQATRKNIIYKKYVPTYATSKRSHSRN
jgi:hypothetical protein